MHAWCVVFFLLLYRGFTLSVCAVFAEWFFAFEMLVDNEGKLSFWQAEGWGLFAQVHHLMVGVPCPCCPVSSAEAFGKMCPTTRKVGESKEEEKEEEDEGNIDEV